ncbi:carbonic anhydrase [Chryseolinea sp. H1M3-3]|uniref:carbonic anhydrase n=1 Tax=Chryseolinea sp. H1M3-3 TaxID=3034144 RepID=UPI0023EA7B78|nr:carbonic anhydrase [Chryseolinea sp. H1M3-3]
MTAKEKMFLESKAWALEKLSLDENYFHRLAAVSNPEIFWIGSLDNLVPVRELISSGPGDLLVYRNIGTQVREDDASLMATLEMAVQVYDVKHIIVCGYSHCTGINEVLSENHQTPHLKKWLEELREIYEVNFEKFRGLDLDQKKQLLSELNIKAQILKLSQFEVIQKSWEKSDHPILLGWYFDLISGGLKEIFTMEENHRVEQVATLTQNI